MKGLPVSLFAVGLLSLAIYKMSDLDAKGTHPANMACNTCHLAQGKITKNNAKTLVASQEVLCKSCHPNAVAASHPSGVKPSMDIPERFPLDWKGDLTCSTCHKIHSHERGLPRVRERGRKLCLSCHDKNFFRDMKDGGMSIMISGHLDARAPLSGEMDTFSIQCMACHETLGDNLAVQMSGNVMRHSSDRGNHPVGVLYSRAMNYGGYRKEMLLPKEIVLPNGKVSCISCHHGYSDKHGKLVMQNTGSRLCFSCHDI